VLNNLTAWAFTSGEVRLKSDGTPWRPLVHAEDIARAFIAVLEAPRELVHNEAFNVGSTTENYRIADLAAIVRDTVPKSSIGFAEGASPDRRNYRVNCDKFANRFPAFAPRWTARRGARQLHRAFVAHGLRLDDFEGPRFKRITHIQELLAGGLLDPTLRPLQMEAA
jgi:nucleoside-diphosphate-sugar epimerase